MSRTTASVRRNHSRTRWIVTALAVVAFLFSLAVPGQAFAEKPVWLGGGSGILVLTGQNNASACTLTTIGTDQNNNLVGLTAGHCGQPGQKVMSETFAKQGPVGTIVAKNSKLDYAIIRFDASKVRPTRTVGGVTIRKLATTNSGPSFGQILCKQGRSSGNTCGVTWFSNGSSHFSQICVVEGDSGSPVVIGDRLIGMVNAFYLVACLGPETGSNIGTIMASAAKLPENVRITKFTPVK